MLERLSIQNIALIKKQSIEFTNGLNVLTGETGAGKSLIIDSLSLLLGERADKTLITHGEKFLSVEAVFTGLSKVVKQTMVELGLEEDDTLIVSRKISLDGKNECRVNGNTFTLSMLKKLSAPLMDLHGQFEHQNLLKVSNHLNILDLYGGKEVCELKKDFSKKMEKYKNILSELDEFVGDDKERVRLIELYEFQMKEIDDAGFYIGEEEELKEFRNKILHQEKIINALSSVSKMLGGDGYDYSGIVDSVKKSSSVLNSISNYYKETDGFIERLDSLKIELEDIIDGVEASLNAIYIDEEKARENESRLDLLSSLKKKYGYTIEQINEYREQIGIEYDKLINSSNIVEKLQEDKIKLEKELREIGDKLTLKRKNVSSDFESEVKNELSALGMKSASFVVSFLPLEIQTLNQTGLDKIEFMFSANKGQEVKPLKNVASGGEMSRFMLAVKNITAKLEGVATLIFDEIDTGVSGQIALVLAEKLGKVSKMAQIICVTHLAQIASFGKTHLFIEKTENEIDTTTFVKELSKNERKYEIARLISGNLTESSLLHAEEMLEIGEKFYNNLK